MDELSGRSWNSEKADIPRGKTSIEKLQKAHRMALLLDPAASVQEESDLQGPREEVLDQMGGRYICDFFRGRTE